MFGVANRGVYRAIEAAGGGLRHREANRESAVYL